MVVSSKEFERIFASTNNGGTLRCFVEVAVGTIMATTVVYTALAHWYSSSLTHRHRKRARREGVEDAQQQKVLGDLTLRLDCVSDLLRGGLSLTDSQTGLVLSSPCPATPAVVIGSGHTNSSKAFLLKLFAAPVLSQVPLAGLMATRLSITAKLAAEANLLLLDTPGLGSDSWIPEGFLTRTVLDRRCDDEEFYIEICKRIARVVFIAVGSEISVADHREALHALKLRSGADPGGQDNGAVVMVHDLQGFTSPYEAGREMDNIRRWYAATDALPGDHPDCFQVRGGDFAGLVHVPLINNNSVRGRRYNRRSLAVIATIVASYADVSRSFGEMLCAAIDGAAPRFLTPLHPDARITTSLHSVTPSSGSAVGPSRFRVTARISTSFTSESAKENEKKTIHLEEGAGWAVVTCHVSPGLVTEETVLHQSLMQYHPTTQTLLVQIPATSPHHLSFTRRLRRETFGAGQHVTLNTQLKDGVLHIILRPLTLTESGDYVVVDAAQKP